MPIDRLEKEKVVHPVLNYDNENEAQVEDYLKNHLTPQEYLNIIEDKYERLPWGLMPHSFVLRYNTPEINDQIDLSNEDLTRRDLSKLHFSDSKLLNSLASENENSSYNAMVAYKPEVNKHPKFTELFSKMPDADSNFIDSLKNIPEQDRIKYKDNITNYIHKNKHNTPPKEALSVFSPEEMENLARESRGVLKSVPDDVRNKIIDEKLGITGGSHEDEDLAQDPENNYQNWSHGADYDYGTYYVENFPLTDAQADHIARHGTPEQQYAMFHNNSNINPEIKTRMYGKWLNDDYGHGYDADKYKEQYYEDAQANMYEDDELRDAARDAAMDQYTYDEFLRDTDWKTWDEIIDSGGSEEEARKAVVEKHYDGDEDRALDSYDESLNDSEHEHMLDLAREKYESGALDNHDFLPKDMVNHESFQSYKDEMRARKEAAEREAAAAQEREEKPFHDSRIPNRDNTHNYGQSQHHHEMLKEESDSRGGAVDVGHMIKNYPNLKDEWKQIFGNKGKLTSEEIQQKIDTIPKVPYAISYGKWGKNNMQNINSQDQTIMRLDHSPESLNKLKEHGIYDTFKKISELSRRSGHPTNANSIAWARVDTSDPKHWMVDEVQSDFASTARDFLKQNDKNEDAEALDKIINLHGNWREALLNKVIKIAKANGVEKISTHSPESKAAHTGAGKVHSVYKDSYQKVPRKMGFTPSEAETLPLSQKGKEIFGSAMSKESASDKINKHYAALKMHLNNAKVFQDLKVSKGKELGFANRVALDLQAKQHLDMAKKHKKEAMQLDPTHKIKYHKMEPVVIQDGVFDEHIGQNANDFGIFATTDHDRLLEKQKTKSHQGHTLDLTPKPKIEKSHSPFLQTLNKARSILQKDAPRAKYPKLLPANQRPEQDVRRIESGNPARPNQLDSYTPFEKMEKGSAQRRLKFNPADVNPKERQAVEGWTSNYPDYDRPQTPLKGNALVRALHKLHSATKTRRNPETGEREFLLYRGKTGRDSVNGLNQLSSFTPHKRNAIDFNRDFVNSLDSDYAKTEIFGDTKHPHSIGSDISNPNRDKYIQDNLAHVYQAWVPESAIHHVPKQIGGTNLFSAVTSPRLTPKKAPFANEHEVIVDTSRVKDINAIPRHQIEAEHFKELHLKHGGPQTRLEMKKLDKAVQSTGSAKDQFPKTYEALKLDGDTHNPAVMQHHMKLHEKHALAATSPESAKHHWDNVKKIQAHLGGKLEKDIKQPVEADTEDAYYVAQTLMNPENEKSFRKEWEKAIKTGSLKKIPIQHAEKFSFYGHGRKVPVESINNPIIVAQTASGKNIVLDGNHRLIHHIKNQTPMVNVFHFKAPHLDSLDAMETQYAENYKKNSNLNKSFPEVLKKANAILQKARKASPVGTITERSDGKYIKTQDGWEPYTQENINQAQSYINARQSTFANVGEDIKGAARHKRATYTPGDKVTSENNKELINHYANTLAEEIGPHNPLNPFVLKQVIARFPKMKPGVDEGVYNNYLSHVTDFVEKNKSNPEIFTTLLNGLKRSLIDKINHDRKQPEYVRGSDSFIIKYVNNTISPYRVATGRVTKDLADFTAAAKTASAGHTGTATPTNDQLMGFFHTPEGTKFLKDAMGGKMKKPESEDSRRQRKLKYAPVDRYVKIAERKGPPVGLDTPQQQVDFLTKAGKIRGLQWGNSVTDPEREHHLKYTAEALKDLMDVTGMPLEMISFNGRLGLAFGARGKGRALAHYEPSEMTINLTRQNGVGSLSHEWGHFLDNVLAKTHNTWTSDEYMYLSEGSQYKMRREESPVAAAMTELINSDGWNEFSKSSRQHLLDLRKEGYGVDSKYWLTPKEMFARAFECHIDHKLKTMGRTNTYLTGVTRGGFWPSEEISAKMAPLFDKFFEELNKSEHLKKSIDLLNKSVLQKAIPAGMIYVQMDGDNMGHSVQRAVMNENIEGARKISKIINDGGAAAKAKAEELGAEIIISGGDDLSFLIPENSLNIIDEVRKAFSAVTGFTVTAGYANSIQGAIEALLWGKLHGKNKIVKWTPEIREFIRNLPKQTEEQKILESGVIPSPKAQMQKSYYALKKSKYVGLIKEAKCNLKK